MKTIVRFRRWPDAHCVTVTLATALPYFQAPSRHPDNRALGDRRDGVTATPHISGTSLSAQARYAAGTREILECYFEDRPIRNEYLVVQGRALAGIRRARDLGFSIEQVRALLDLSDDRTRDCATVDHIAGEHLREVDRKIADLMALRCELSAVTASCGGGTVGECRIIKALAPDPEAARSRV